jgi:hypothetical protein
VLAFCAHSTAYARHVWDVSWREVLAEALLVAPELAGRGGALVPRALGESLRIAMAGQLTTSWLSSDGVRVLADRLN